jgi:hypothetical protein
MAAKNKQNTTKKNNCLIPQTLVNQINTTIASGLRGDDQQISISHLHAALRMRQYLSHKSDLIHCSALIDWQCGQ